MATFERSSRMIIKNDFTINDAVSGLKISVVKGKTLDRLQIKHIGKPITTNRDFWFTKKGKFNGTGSGIG